MYVHTPFCHLFSFSLVHYCYFSFFDSDVMFLPTYIYPLQFSCLYMWTDEDNLATVKMFVINDIKIATFVIHCRMLEKLWTQKVNISHISMQFVHAMISLKTDFSVKK